MSIELLLGAEAAIHFPGLVDEFTKFQVSVTNGINVKKVSRKGQVRPCVMKLQQLHDGTPIITWGGRGGKTGTPVIEIHEVTSGPVSDVLEKYGDPKLAEQYLSLVQDSRTLDILTESNEVRDSIVKCMRLLVSIEAHKEGMKSPGSGLKSSPASAASLNRVLSGGVGAFEAEDAEEESESDSEEEGQMDEGDLEELNCSAQAVEYEDELLPDDTEVELSGANPPSVPPPQTPGSAPPSVPPPAPPPMLSYMKTADEAAAAASEPAPALGSSERQASQVVLTTAETEDGNETEVKLNMGGVRRVSVRLTAMDANGEVMAAALASAEEGGAAEETGAGSGAGAGMVMSSSAVGSTQGAYQIAASMDDNMLKRPSSRRSSNMSLGRPSTGADSSAAAAEPGSLEAEASKLSITEETDEAPESNFMQGWLHKESGGKHNFAGVLGTNWRKRFFVLQNDTLRYFIDDGMDNMKGSIYLDEVHEVRALPGTEVVAKGADVVGAEMYQFELCTSSRNWMLATETEEEREQWVKSISRTSSVISPKSGEGSEGSGSGPTAGRRKSTMLNDILSGKTMFRGNSKHDMGAARKVKGVTIEGEGEMEQAAEDAASGASGSSAGSGARKRQSAPSRDTDTSQRSTASRFGIGSGFRSRFAGKSTDKPSEAGTGFDEDDEFDGDIDETALTAQDALPYAIMEAASVEEQVAELNAAKRSASRGASADAAADDDGYDLPSSAFKQVRKSTLNLNGTKFEFEDYAPTAFWHIRRRFNIDSRRFLESMCAEPLTGGEIGEGKSGMLFFFSWDKDYISKTLTAMELPFFQRILEEYYTYMTCNADETLLPRFFGLYKIRIPGRPTYRIVVMNNLFQVPVGVKLKISEMYDLKGSLRNRFVTDDEKAAGVSVLKDVNFVLAGRRIMLGPDYGPKLYNQLQADTEWLKAHMIMDYSLLVGIAMEPATDDAAAAAEGEEEHHREEPFFSMWQQEMGGLTARELDGSVRSETYFFGIIDILQEYNMKKKLEHAYKAQILRKDPTKISAVNPVVYGDRFFDFMTKQVLQDFRVKAKPKKSPKSKKTSRARSKSPKAEASA